MIYSEQRRWGERSQTNKKGWKRLESCLNRHEKQLDDKMDKIIQGTGIKTGKNNKNQLTVHSHGTFLKTRMVQIGMAQIVKQHPHNYIDVYDRPGNIPGKVLAVRHTPIGGNHDQLENI